MMQRNRTILALLTVAVLAGLAAVPLLSAMAGDAFFVTLFTRVLVFSLAAVGLNLLLGYGGLVSFGHSLYVAIGAYAVGMLMQYGITNGWLHLLCGLVFGGVTAFAIGLVCLRTSGMTFIMITLAFAQMFYFVAVGLKQFGGDEGMSLPSRSTLAPFDIADNVVLYYVLFAVLILAVGLIDRLIHAEFGLALSGTKQNPQRMRSLGFSVLRYQLVTYVLSGLICVIAGFFFANLTRFVSPSYLHWSLSGELIVMVVLGGMASPIGPVLGAAALVLLEEFLASANFGFGATGSELLHQHWKLLLGLFIIGVALLLKNGLYGLVRSRWGHR
jgi:branched-chain amino acid transport system permease protein